MGKKSKLGEPIMRWPDSSPPPGTRTDTEVAEYLRSTLRIADLSAKHPLREVWKTTSAQARFGMHHLADDLKALEGVPGWNEAVKKLRTDFEAYDDTRYELRIAAALARAGQKVSDLAGNRAGPDLQFVSSSGHECGVACYRSRSATPAVADLRKASQALARQLFQLHSFIPGASMRLFDVVLPEIPVLSSHLEATKNLLQAAWTSREPQGERVAEGHVAWAPLPRQCLRSSESEAVYLRVRFKHRAYELRRAHGHIRDKIQLESKWAASFRGTPIIAIEESDAIAGGGSAEIVRASLTTDGAAFSGALVTYFARDVLTDDMRYFAGVRHDPGLRINLTTFGPSVQVWAQGQEIHQWCPEHSREHWRVARGAGGQYLELLRSLTYPIASFRTDRPQTRNPADDPAYMARITEAIQRMQAYDNELVPPPALILPLSDKPT